MQQEVTTGYSFRQHKTIGKAKLKDTGRFIEAMIWNFLALIELAPDTFYHGICQARLSPHNQNPQANPLDIDRRIPRND